MFEGIINFFKKFSKNDDLETGSKDTAKERLHLVLMQDRANVSADFLEMMKMEIVDVIKKYIDVDETDMDVKLENRVNDDGTSGAPALYANIPIVGINEEKKKESVEIGKAKQAEEIIENKENDDTKKEETVKKTTAKKTVSTKKSVSAKKSTTKATSSKTRKSVKSDTNKTEKETKKQ